MPAAADPGLEPRREIPHAERRRRSNIAKVTSTVSRWNVHAATEGDGKVRVIAADAGPFAESLRGAACGACVLIIEGDMVMNVIADCLHARVTRSYGAEKLPGCLRQQVGLTIAAAQKEHEGLFGQILDRVLPGCGHNLIQLAAIPDHAVGSKAQAAGRR